MNRPIAYLSLTALLTAGLMACATDERLATVPSTTPAIQTQTIDGQVVRNEGDAYIIRESSGRQTRVYLDRNSVRDPIAVGDPVVVLYDPATGYATSIKRLTGAVVPPVVAPVVVGVPTNPPPQTIEGVVQRLEGSDYVIKDLSGKEVRLNVDRSTRLDGNITAGDRVVALTNPMVAHGAYVSNMYILGSPGVVQGEIVRIDGDGYVIRDLTGREMRVETNAATVRNGNPTVGDRIIAYVGPSSGLHADSIMKR